MTRARMLAVILLASSGIALPACLPLGCGAVGGVQGLDVDLQFTSTPQVGDYTIVVRADGLAATLHETFGPGSWISTDGNGGRLELVDGAKHLEVDVACGPSDELLHVGYLEGEGGGPAQLEVELLRGTQVLVDQTLTPTYAVSYPNGESCPGMSDDAPDQTITVPSA